METRAHHILIGAFTLVVFLAALGFVLWLSKYGADRQNAYYDVIFNESVTGLSRGGMVQYNGITVGEVMRLSLDPRDPRKVVARVRLGARTPVKVDTTAVLAYTGVTGVAFIQLSGGTPKSAPLEKQPDQEFPTIVAQESAFSKLLASGDDIVTSANDALVRAGRMLSEKNIEKVSSVLANLEQLTGTLAEQREDLGHALGQLAAATDQLRSTLVTLDRMAGNADTLLRDDAPALVASMRQSLQNIERLADNAANLVADNRAAVDAFSRNGLRQVGPALDDLRTTLRSLERAASKSTVPQRCRTRRFIPA
jgi:phospholipid/cholesterol/gamma-HCH transport system substrate-binding protein